MLMLPLRWTAVGIPSPALHAPKVSRSPKRMEAGVWWPGGRSPERCFPSLSRVWPGRVLAVVGRWCGDVLEAEVCSRRMLARTWYSADRVVASRRI
jgi:hypothetical protein